MTKKVVINGCYGGFGLSLQGLDLLAKLKGDGELHHYELDLESRFYKKVSSEQIDEGDGSGLFVFTLNKNIGEQFHEKDSYEFLEKYLYRGETERHDSDLIEVVEGLGEKASGKFSDLRIVEIPKDIDYVIEEYDGNEWVAEKHRTWS